MVEMAWNPAEDWDVWLRALTDKRQCYERVEDGKRKVFLHNRALKGKVISPPLEERPWLIEISGKLLSLVGDPVDEGERFIARIKPNKADAVFHGYAYAGVKTIREVERIPAPCAPVEVMATPKSDDVTHADTVLMLDAGEVPAEAVDVETAKQMLRDWLQEVLEVVGPADVRECLERLRPD